MIHRCAALLRAWVLLHCLLALAPAFGADPDVCAICGANFKGGYYTFEDKVALEKKHVCQACESSFPACFVCGLPADTNLVGVTELPDHRVICARDAKTAILNEEEVVRICHDVRDRLDRLFSRFTSFPETNVTVRMVDRVHLVGLLKLAGNDYRCPNVWGITETKTNHHRVRYEISLMSGLPQGWLQATCAHEYGHTWVQEHVAASRRRGLDRDAEEGFCELLGFLLMGSLDDSAGQRTILNNNYTRGQIDLFVAAEQTYGFNEILDWMQFGADARLSATAPDTIRKLLPSRPGDLETTILVPAVRQAVAPRSLELKAIFWDQKHPLALINDHSFGLNEEAPVHVGNSNVVVRCLAITPEAVQLKIVGSAHEETLTLKSP